MYESGVYSIGYPSETYLKLKSREISLIHNIFLICPIILEFYAEHGNITVVLCAQSQNDWVSEW